MTVIPFPSPGPRRARFTSLIPHVTIHGSFRSPSGREGTMTGFLRLDRFTAVDGRPVASGVFAGTLRDADGSRIGVGSRRCTLPVSLAPTEAGMTAAVGPVTIDVLGMDVTFPQTFLRWGRPPS